MIKTILTDIEGTTTSIDFVHKTLFPYSKKNLANYLSKTTDQEVRETLISVWVDDLGEAKTSPVDLERVITLMSSWIDEDRKHPALKFVQGKIWKHGYESNAYSGHVYDDVKPAFEKWKKEGLGIAIYSSGSVEAQKLIFGFSEAGDLTRLIDHYFDTSVGHKREVDSYRKIASELNTDPSSILFLSDIKEELDAAKGAGMKTIQLLRMPLPARGDHQGASDFEEVRRLIEE